MPPKPFTSKELTTIADRARELYRAYPGPAEYATAPEDLLDLATHAERMAMGVRGIAAFRTAQVRAMGTGHRALGQGGIDKSLAKPKPPAKPTRKA
jgi:hypothetical protein